MLKDKIKYQEFSNVSDASELGILAQGIAKCVHSAFGGTVTQEDAYDHMKGDLILVGQKGKKVVCFSNTSFISPNELCGKNDISNVVGCYLAGATVSKNVQGHGIYKDMNEMRISMGLDRNYKLIFTRTQNPRVEAGIKASLESLKKEGFISNYTLKKYFLPGYYGQMLTKRKPKSKSVKYNKLNQKAGDAYLLMFNITY